MDILKTFIKTLKCNKHLYNKIAILVNYISTQPTKDFQLNQNINRQNYITLILASLFTNFDLYLYSKKKVQFTDELFESIYKTGYNVEFIGIDFDNLSSKIYTNNQIIKIEDIVYFYKYFNKYYNTIIPKGTVVNIDSISLIYLSYFSLFLINNTINSSSKIYISNDYNTFGNNKGIFIGDKYIYKYPKKSFNLFYSSGIGQFLIYNVKLINNNIIGKLFDYVVVNNKDIYYKKTQLNIPSSYQLYNNNCLIINNTLPKINIENKVNISDSNYDILFNNNKEVNISKLIFINTKLFLNEIVSYQIYRSILLTFPQIMYTKDDLSLKTIFLYETVCNLELSLFSLFVENKDNKSKIILHISSEIQFLEKSILNHLYNTVLKLGNKCDININQKIITKKTCKKFDFIIELKTILIITKIVLVLIKLNKIHKNIKLFNTTNQISYTLEYNNMHKLITLAKKTRINVPELFRISLMATMFKIYNSLIYFTNDTNSYYLTDIFNNNSIKKCNSMLKVYSKSEYINTYFKDILVSLIKNNYIRYETIYINEVSLDNYNNILTINKSNIKSTINNIPININYYITKKYIQLTIAYQQNYRNIQTIIPELLNYISSQVLSVN